MSPSARICPGCAFRTVQAVALCPLCGIPLAAQPRPAARARTVVSVWPDEVPPAQDPHLPARGADATRADGP